jgi:adenosylmethionine-8-amino-7-oxononanoate aminotransferase
MASAAMNQGVALMVHWNVVILAPPLIITPAEAKRGLSVLDEVLEIADKAAD